uniref:U3 small nucleolar RNA-associated protein 6 homolog n=1 Tax=Anopheles atroparvus TaxID=41427 RepID=A0AAG5CWR9_ANOAO
MAELIELRREETIREYECMKHLKLFTDKEIRSIKTKRLHLDYKVERRSKNLTDFINYITYECNLFDLLLVRRKKLHITAEWTSLEKSINSRVRVLYKRALTRFASEYRLWTHFMRYCQMRRFYIEGSRVLDQMLSFHGDKPKAWLSAINWEYRLAKNATRAKHYNLRGLQRHPCSRELCLSLIGMQFEEATNIVTESKETAADLLRTNNTLLTKALKMAQLAYSNFEKKDVQFFQQLFEELMKYRPLSAALAKEAIETMQASLADKEEMWDLLANLALQGNEFVMTEECSEFKEQLAKCITIYNEGITRLPTMKMYTFYIEAMLKLNASEDGLKEPKAKRKALANAFREAMAADRLEEEKMQQYLKLLLHNPNPNDELVMAVINRGIEQYPSSTGIWSLYMRYMIQKEAGPDQVEALFRQATAKVPDNARRLTLWKMLFHYYHSRADLCENVVDLYRKAISHEPEIAHHFQPLFLEHLMNSSDDGIVSARREYQRMVKSFTTPLELHQKMARLEAGQAQKNVNEWRSCHEHATQRFGKENASVWVEYIQFERDHGQAKLMQTLYERAKATLDEDAFALFLPEYELLKNPLL